MRKLAVAYLVGLLTTVAALATTILPMSLDELTRRSDSIVVGKVKSVAYAQNEISGYPETQTTVTIENTVYGDDKVKEVVISVPGGPAGNGLVTIVPGMPQFKVDERAVLFLVRDKDRGVCFPTGAEQGVFRIKVDPVTKQSYVQNQAHDLSVIEVPDDPIQQKNVGKSKVALPEFTIQLRRLANQLKEE